LCNPCRESAFDLPFDVVNSRLVFIFWGLTMRILPALSAVLVLAAVFCSCSKCWCADSPTDPALAINDYRSCAVAGNKILKSYPPKCVTPDGRIFTAEPLKIEPPNRTGAICVDRCGDGVCQEIVCMAEGCPCAETVGSCPQDCGRQ
jgi:hypothetical protein